MCRTVSTAGLAAPTDSSHVCETGRMTVLYFMKWPIIDRAGSVSDRDAMGSRDRMHSVLNSLDVQACVQEQAGTATW